MAAYDEPMPKWLEEELRQIGIRTPEAAPLEEPPKKQPPIDRWWERGEECPH